MDKSDRQKKYGYLGQLSTTYLEEILCRDIDSSEGGDEDMILYIMEVIEKREKKNATGTVCDVDEAFQEFQEHYMNLDAPLYPTSHPNNFSDKEANNSPSKVRKFSNMSYARRSPAHRTSRTFLKQMISIAAAITVLLAVMITAQAVGIDVFGTLARWTDETFRFISPSSGNEELTTTLDQDDISSERRQLRDAFQAALDECGVSTALAPGWFPDGCIMTGEPKTILTDYSVKVSCEYSTLADQIFVFSVQKYSSSFSPELLGTEKDDGPVEQYLTNGRMFYVMSNNGSVNAAWSDGKSISIKIFGDIPTEILKQLLDSIGE